MTEKTLDTFMNDPIGYFDSSITKMHTLPRAELEPLQREAMARRFGEHREGIEMVRNLADRLGIEQVKEFDDIAPLFFAHTAFKSYPAALLDNKRFDLMTRWLQSTPRKTSRRWTSRAATASRSGSTASTPARSCARSPPRGRRAPSRSSRRTRPAATTA
jgi:hypothetical protein